VLASRHHIEVDLLQRGMSESLSRMVDRDSVVTLLSADVLQLLDTLPVLNDFRVVSSKVLTLIDDPLSLIGSLLSNQSSMEG